MNNRSSNVHKDRHWDVIVVGARVAGAATAMLLARAGLRVLCVDRSRYGADTVSTHALMRGGVLQLQRWGVLDAVADAGTPPVRRTVFHYGAESIGVSIRPSAGVDALYAPRRTVIDALLVDAAHRAGATVEFGAAVAGLARDGDGRVAGVIIEDRRAGVGHGAGAIRLPAPWLSSAPAREESSGRHWSSVPTAGIRWWPAPRVPLPASAVAGQAATCTATGPTFHPMGTSGSTDRD